MFDRVFDAANRDRVRHLAGGAHHKDTTKLLVKNQFRSHPRIGATQDYCKRLLLIDELGAMFDCIGATYSGWFGGSETLVALHQTFERFICIQIAGGLI